MAKKFDSMLRCWDAFFSHKHASEPSLPLMDNQDAVYAICLRALKKSQRDLFLASSNRLDNPRQDAAIFIQRRMNTHESTNGMRNYYRYFRNPTGKGWHLDIEPTWATPSPNTNIYFDSPDYIDLSRLSPFMAQLYISACSAQQMRTGNCRLYSSCIATYILRFKTPVIKRLELIEFINLDHFALLVNRDPQSHIDNPTTWNGLVIDGWGFDSELGLFHSRDLIKQVKLLVKKHPNLIKNKDAPLWAVTSEPISLNTPRFTHKGRLVPYGWDFKQIGNLRREAQEYFQDNIASAIRKRGTNINCS